MPQPMHILIGFIVTLGLGLGCSDGYSGAGPYPPYGPGLSFTCAECEGLSPFGPNTSEAACEAFADQFECIFESYSAGVCSENPLPSCTVTDCVYDPSLGCVP